MVYKYFLLLILSLLFVPTNIFANELISPKAREASVKGLQYLLKNQNPDGSWSNNGRFGKYTEVMTSLAGLALLSAGITPQHKEHGQVLVRAGEYILKNAQSDGLLVGASPAPNPMYGHGYAMLFLAQLYGTGLPPVLRDQLEEKLQNAVEFSARAQSASGGWFYIPSRQHEEGSVTITQAQGLRACHNIGIAVPADTMNRALSYLEACSGKDGGMMYSLAHARKASAKSRPAITAAAVATLYAVGQHDSDLNLNLLKFLEIKNKANRINPLNIFRGHTYYGAFYMTQAMWLSGELNWKQYYPAARHALIKLQRADGSWEGDKVGPIYGTAIAIFCLQIPNGYLPILQR